MLERPAEELEGEARKHSVLNPESMTPKAKKKHEYEEQTKIDQLYSGTVNDLEATQQKVEELQISSDQKILSTHKRKKTLSMYDYKKFKRIENISKKYAFGEHLGMGSFGKVQRCQHIDSGSEFAIKIINKELI